MTARLTEALAAFFLDQHDASVSAMSDGLVHQTHLVKRGKDKFVLQEINTKVFRQPSLIAKNMEVVTEHLSSIESYRYQIAKMLPTFSGSTLFTDSQNGIWRCFDFIEHTLMDDHINADMAYVVGYAFGIFDDSLRSLNPKKLSITIPDFHNPDFRVKQFSLSLAMPKIALDQRTKALLKLIEEYKFLAHQFKSIQLPIHVAHNDAKPSNILFDEAIQPIAIIDLDTVMPGSSLFDFADLVRSMANSVSEDVPVSDQLFFDMDIYTALRSGYLDAFSKISAREVEHLALAAKYIIFEQCLRFLTDYLDGSQYYHTAYPTHNLVRAENQMALLESSLAHKL